MLLDASSNQARCVFLEGLHADEDLTLPFFLLGVYSTLTNKNRVYLEEKLRQLKEQHKRLESQWERAVAFAGPAPPNRKLNQCNNKIIELEKRLEEEL